MKLSAPVEPLIANFAASAPPTIEYVSVCAGRSASLATTVVTVAEFSAMLTLASAPPPLDVITGAVSLTGVTVTAMACVSLSAPSLTCTVTS